jgi:RHS repeat-associated protein
MKTESLLKLTFTYLLGLSILLIAAGSVPAQEGESCDSDGVKVGFQGTVCGIGNFFVTLNGVTATGTNTKCLNQIGSNIFFTSTNKAFAKLKVDQKYIVTSGTGICVNHINFDVPPGYTMFIDGFEGTTISKTDGGFSFTGDGSWEVVLRRKCKSCGKDGTGEAGAEAGSVVWQAGLGQLSDGRLAERISIREKTLTAAIYTPSVLIYTPPVNSPGVEVIKAGGILRQIKAPQALADIVVINSSEYDIRYYRPADVGTKVGNVYTVSGSPFVTWKFKNPDPANFTRLEILKYENGASTPSDKSEYVWDPFIDSWTLSTGWSQSTGYARIETILVSYPTSESRTETVIVKNGNGTIVSVTAKTYQTFAWGEELVQEVQDPDDAALTTTYTYYQDPNEDHRYQKLMSVKFPDGLWEKYDYDVFFNISTIMRPWKDLSMETATPANSHLTLYGYTNSDNGVFGTSNFPKIVWDVEEQINGVTVSKMRYNRSIAGIGPDIISVTASSYSGSDNLVAVNLIGETKTTKYRFSAPAFLANRVAWVTNANGTRETYSYEKGNYLPNVDPALSVFVPDVNGLAERQTIVRGTTAAPNGVAFKTTKDTRVRDQYGNMILEETYVYNGTDYERIAWKVNDYDAHGHVTMTRNHKGQVTSAVWTGEFKLSEIDGSGMETVYEYDSLNRIKKQTKKGIAAGGFPAQPDLVTTFVYDAEGQLTTETVEGGGLSLITSHVYDRAGRLKETTEAGLTTIYTYANGGRVETATRAGGSTQVTEKYLDGRLKSVTGTAVVARHFDYGVNADGTRYTQEYTGSAGLSSPRWTKTTVDWMGRPIMVEKPGSTGTTVVTSIYNFLGQLQKETITANSTKLMADKLYEYDALGQQVRTGSDIDNSGTLTLASTDRLSEIDDVFEKTGNDWFQVTTTKDYLTDNNSTAITRTQRDRLTSFPLNGTEQTVAHAVFTDTAGNGSSMITAIDRAAKKRTTTVDTPDSNLNAVSISVNGLLQSSTANTPQSSTTYAYDGLGRQISVTDPRTGTTSQTFNNNGKLATTNSGASTTTYEYYPATHLSAGLLKSQENAASKKVYFAYSSRGELTHTWGDTTYPLKYVYDGYGQRTELHTFRNGQNWTATVWPSSTTGTADVTKWIYQESTGLVTQKQDAVLKGPAYTYDELGRIKTRVWARGITCTYGYDANTGELRTITYSDTTPSISFTYDRGGRQNNVTHAGGTHTRTFNVDGELLTEQIAGGILDGVGITVGFDGFLRRNSLQSTHGANTLSSQTYGYDATSRLETVTSGGQTATYGYHANSGLWNTTTFTGGTSTARTYDAHGRLENITTTPAAAPAQSYAYTYNNLNQRTRVTREDSSYWSYIYNDHGELATGKKYWADNSLVWGAQAEYKFDNIGNLSYARQGGNQLGSLRQSNYTAGSLNQYSQRTVPGAVDVAGAANTAATVTVNNQSAVRKGEYFYKELTVDNSAAPASADVSIVGARNNFGAGGEDAVTEKGGKVSLPQNAEAFTYDDDGNLITDGLWVYTWNAENQLLSMEAAASVSAQAKRRVEFSYDYAGRRIQKKSYTWNIAASAYELVSISKFINDGWNVVVQLDGGGNVQRTYVWGKDNSGSLQGAGGIGGLLLVTEGNDTHQVAYDGNGNVVALTKAGTGMNSGSYEYDPFGNSLKATGEYAASNPFRFSTKYTDSETGHVYFGYRYYNAQTGKWISRDPLEEEGGVNLYAFVTNNPVGNIDPVGLSHREDIASNRLDYTCRCGWVDWSHVAPDGVKVPTLRNMWRSIKSNSGEEESYSKKGYLVMYGQNFDYPYGLGSDGITGSYFVRYNLNRDEQILVTLSIVKEVSERFEKLQQSHVYGLFSDSGFSQEDLVSDLLGANMAILDVYDPETIRKWCRDVPNFIAEDIWDKTGGLKQIKTWEPIYSHLKLPEDNSCCKTSKEPAPRWPDQLLKMRDIPKGELWRDWTLKVDYHYTLY